MIRLECNYFGYMNRNIWSCTHRYLGIWSNILYQQVRPHDKEVAPAQTIYHILMLYSYCCQQQKLSNNTQESA